MQRTYISITAWYGKKYRVAQDMYKAKHRKPGHFDYDLMVIGTGSGGGIAAHLAAKSGKKVAVVEAERVGGECPNFGCVPTKALLQAAEVYQTAREGDRFGIHAKDVRLDYTAIKAWKDHAVDHTGAVEGEAFYESEGIKIIHGLAHFIDPWSVSIKGHRYRARKFLIATGTKSVVPPIPGLAESGFMTYREAIDLTKLPKSVFIIGGGAIGCEFGHLFNSLGSEVQIADFAPRLIALEDPEVGELIGALFENRGMQVHTGAKIMRVTTTGSAKTVHFEKEGRAHQATVSDILLATGKAPNTDLGLENAGVAYDRGGVKVNKYMQTTSKHIYAAGDIVGPYRFTHTAAYQSRVAVHNMFHREHKVAAQYHAVPRCVFTDPEVACVGYTEAQLNERKVAYISSAVPISVIGRSNTSGIDSGFVKVLATKYGTLMGASIVSPRAGEMIHELTLAIQHRMTARTIAETIHAFPTWSEAVRIACQKIK
jgi:dihydrolipoamide dehydrogenase